jgi:N-acetylglucosamine-6-phosphate deacetylase
LDGQKGSLAVGKDADVLVLTRKGALVKTFVSEAE